MQQHQRLDFNFKVKSTADDSGTFEGLASTYGNEDLGHDIVDRGAFTRTLSTHKQFPLLWQHQADNPIGTAKITDTQRGLQIDGRLILTDNPVAQRAYQLIKEGAITGLSIGYDTQKWTYDEEAEVRHLTEVRLWEVSIVTFPMNESAQISSVKAMSDDDKARHFKAIDMHRKAIDRHQRAIRESLKSLFDGLDDDEVDDQVLTEDADLDDETAKEFLIEMRKMITIASA